MILVLNWKMNPSSKEEAEKLLRAEKHEGVVICPPFCFLAGANGAQDVHWEKQGAYTGEISAKMLKNIGVKYVIVGHSERGEEDILVNKKAKAAIKEKIIPIICVEKEEQISPRLDGLRGEFMVAYEPAEEDQPMSPDKALTLAILIKKKLSKNKRKQVKILYGGDVDEKNCCDYPEFSGLLIGKASLDPIKFNKIYARINKN